MPEYADRLWFRIGIGAFVVSLLTLVACWLTDGDPRGLLAFLVILVSAFLGGRIAGTVWSVPTTILVMYGVSALYRGRFSLPNLGGTESTKVLVYWLVWLAVLAGIVLFGVRGGKQVRR